MAWRHRMIARAARLYWRVRGPRTLGVRAVVLDAEGQVALVRHTYSNHWYLPGGGVKKGEGFEAALRRELREEVAIENPEIERVLGIYHNRREGKDDHIVVFAVRVVGDADRLRRADLREIEDLRWFALNDLPADTSPATRRRLDEYRAGRTGVGAW